MRIIRLAAEDVDIGVIGKIRKMTGDQGRFDQLDHRISCHALFFAEVDHLTFTEAFHADEFTELDDILPDPFCASNCPGVAGIEIETGEEAPRGGIRSR
jgi:hypothetical protein